MWYLQSAYIRWTLPIGWPSNREQLGRRRVIDVGGGHQDRQQQTHAVHHDMAFPAVDVLGVVATPLLAAAGRVDRLAVNAGRGTGVVRLLHRPHLAAEDVVDPVQGPIPPPLVEVAPDGALGREVDGQVAPLAAGANEIEDGIQDIPQVGLAGPPTAGLGRDVWLDQGPVGISEVTGVRVRSHTTTTSATDQLFPLWDSLSSSSFALLRGGL